MSNYPYERRVFMSSTKIIKAEKIQPEEIKAEKTKPEGKERIRYNASVNYDELRSCVHRMKNR